MDFYLIFTGCEVDDFKCFNDRCLRPEKKCNGEVDCARGEDEINCRKLIKIFFLNNHGNQFDSKMNGSS